MKLMRKIFTLLVVILCIKASAQMPYYQQNYEVPKKYILGGVEMEGAVYLDKDILIHNIAGLTIGQTINMPGEEISRAIENLWRQHFFSDLQVIITKIEEDKIYLTTEVTSTLSRFWRSSKKQFITTQT